MASIKGEPDRSRGERVTQLEERLAELRANLREEDASEHPPPLPSTEDQQRAREKMKKLARLVFMTLDRSMLRAFVHELARLEAERARDSSP